MASSAVANKATIFVNTSSGWDEKDEAPALLRRLFTEHGWDADIQIVQKGTNITRLAEDAIEAGSRVIIAGGGDGTIRAVAEAVAGTGAAMGILPVGTFNHFARDLKVPLDLEAAARLIPTLQPRPVDVAEVNGRIFVNNSIVGLYPIYRFFKDAEERKGRHGFFATLKAAYAVLRRNPFFTLKFDVDGRAIVRRTPYVLIANNRHAMEGYHLGTRESLDEGRVWLYIMRRQGRFGLVRLALKLILGRFRAEDDMEVIPAERVRIESARPTITVALDGEIVELDAPLQYRSIASGLNVLAPGQAEE